MKVNVLYRHAVRTTLRLGKKSVYGENVPLDAVWQREMIGDDVSNVVQCGMGVIVMVFIGFAVRMIVMVFVGIAVRVIVMVFVGIALRMIVMVFVGIALRMIVMVFVGIAARVIVMVFVGIAVCMVVMMRIGVAVRVGGSMRGIQHCFGVCSRSALCDAGLFLMGMNSSIFGYIAFSFGRAGCDKRIRSDGFLSAVAENREMRSGDAAFLHILCPYGDPGNAERLKRAEKVFAIRQKLKQGSGQHVACRTHAAIQIKCFHKASVASALPAAEEGVLSLFY